MTKRMLIDAAHPEETRVVVADEYKLEELDTETSTKKQLKGNIYLAKVTRVEPSLQAAFVEYGGNRHGFLAFNEIHPDYYRIPVEDREALLAETAAAAAAEDHEEDGDGESDNLETLGGDESDEIERVGEAQRNRLRSLTRQYRIQEVIKRRQILLVQVVKEERGNKGAALTTYMSLAGRYCVLMPNTARGGGISRKIVNPAHRKRLKSILTSLEVPDGMAVILRTAGVERSRVEMRRDYEYLRRTWDEIRELTLKSTAPSLIYEEGNLIKRSLRDLYTREIEEVIIDGEEAYKTARTLMRTMIPSHARRVQLYSDPVVPLFHKFKIEGQLDAIHEQTVHLPAGGYIVINPTEALVAIDVNSGRATRERNIEQTARRTNLEAAEEVARQLRLRDLAGLIVIDFIDMDDSKNNAAVERRLKEAMKNDRARIQVGRISAFGLLELSRQRLRPSLAEANAETCPTCSGAGHVRSTESAALRVLRGVEEECLRKKSTDLVVRAPAKVALYLLNQKRNALNDITARHGVALRVNVDEELMPPAYELEHPRGSGAGLGDGTDGVVRQGQSSGRDDAKSKRETAGRDSEARADRSRRRGRHRPADAVRDNEPAAEEGEVIEARDDVSADHATNGESENDRPRRRRGRRGGRRRRRDGTIDSEGVASAVGEEAASTAGDHAEADDTTSEKTDEPIAETKPADGGDVDSNDTADAPVVEKPARRRSRGGRRRRGAAAPAEDAPDGAAADETAAEEGADLFADGSQGDTAVADAASEPVDGGDTAEADVVKKPRARRGGGRRRTRAASSTASDEAASEEAGADSPVAVTSGHTGDQDDMMPPSAPIAVPENGAASMAAAPVGASELNEDDDGRARMGRTPPPSDDGEDEDGQPRRRGWWNRFGAG